MKKCSSFALIEVLISLSIMVILIPLITGVLYGGIKRYSDISLYNRERAQIVFAEEYLKDIVRGADSLTEVAGILHIDTGAKYYKVGVKKNKLYVQQTATRYLTVEPMKIVSNKIIKVNDKYYQIEVITEDNRKYIIPLLL